tara:strand:- start:385 stop:1128 length:744 start_codon:yes stop_codon:yes gene_type:complete
MISFFKKKSISLRNLFNIKPVYINTTNIPENTSVSDQFIWRTDSDYNTFFRFSDLLKLYFGSEENSFKLVILNNMGDLIFSKKLNFNNNLEEINFKTILENKKGYGTFSLFHFSDKKNFKNVIRNSCYTSFSYNNSLPSNVHGNVPVYYEKQGKLVSKIIGNSIFCNNKYNLQDTFKNYEKSEIFISNPTSRKLKVYINDNKIILNKWSSAIYDVSNLSTVSLYSNCYYLRPYIFKKNNNYIDVHHG